MLISTLVFVDWLECWCLISPSR